MGCAASAGSSKIDRVAPKQPMSESSTCFQRPSMSKILPAPAQKLAGKSECALIGRSVILLPSETTVDKDRNLQTCQLTSPPQVREDIADHSAKGMPALQMVQLSSLALKFQNSDKPIDRIPIAGQVTASATRLRISGLKKQKPRRQKCNATDDPNSPMVLEKKFKIKRASSLSDLLNFQFKLHSAAYPVASPEQRSTKTHGKTKLCSLLSFSPHVKVERSVRLGYQVSHAATHSNVSVTSCLGAGSIPQKARSKQIAELRSPSVRIYTLGYPAGSSRELSPLVSMHSPFSRFVVKDEPQTSPEIPAVRLVSRNADLCELPIERVSTASPRFMKAVQKTRQALKMWSSRHQSQSVRPQQQ